MRMHKTLKHNRAHVRYISHLIHHSFPKYFDQPTKRILSTTAHPDEYRCMSKHVGSLDCLLCNCTIPPLDQSFALEGVLPNVTAAAEENSSKIYWLTIIAGWDKLSQLVVEFHLSLSFSPFTFTFFSLSVLYIVLPHSHLNIHALASWSLNLACQTCETLCFFIIRFTVGHWDFKAFVFSLFTLVVPWTCLSLSSAVGCPRKVVGGLFSWMVGCVFGWLDGRLLPRSSSCCRGGVHPAPLLLSHLTSTSLADRLVVCFQSTLNVSKLYQPAQQITLSPRLKTMCLLPALSNKVYRASERIVERHRHERRTASCQQLSEWGRVHSNRHHRLL